MTTILDRDGWGAAPAKRATPHPITSRDNAVETIVIHHSVTRTGPFAEILQSIQNGHLNHPTIGYADIAYNGAASSVSSLAANLRGPLTQGGATGHPHDRTSLSIVAVGNYHDPLQDNPTPTLIANIAQLIATWIRAGHVTRTPTLQPHSHYSATACPGDRLRAALPSITAAVAAATSQRTPTDPPDPHLAALKQIRAIADTALEQ